MVLTNLELIVKETIIENLCLSCLRQIQARFCAITDELANHWTELNESKIKKWAKEIIIEWQAYNYYLQDYYSHELPHLNSINELIVHFFKSNSSKKIMLLIFKELGY